MVPSSSNLARKYVALIFYDAVRYIENSHRFRWMVLYAMSSGNMEAFQELRKKLMWEFVFNICGVM